MPWWAWFLAGILTGAALPIGGSWLYVWIWGQTR